MRAAQIIRFGDAESLELSDVPVPVPQATEVLVRITATSVNSVDIAHREGRFRMLAGRRVPQGIGIDLVGTVESTGSAVRGFSRGERVWGIEAGASWMKSAVGSAAEYAVLDTRRLALAPESLNDIEAASLVTSGYTALRAVKDIARLQPGERVLIRGAAGGVGSAAIQTAVALGAHVAALASPSSERFVRDLGATEFFDYSTATPASVGAVDVLIDTVGSDLLAWRRTLTRHGRMVGVAFNSLSGVTAIGASGIYFSRRIRTFAGQPPAGALATLSRFVSDHGIRGAVHAIYPLADIAEGHRVFSGRGVQGKIVVEVAG